MISIKIDLVVDFTIEKPTTNPKLQIFAAKTLPLLPLKHVLYIYQLLQFKKNQAKV